MNYNLQLVSYPVPIAFVLFIPLPLSLFGLPYAVRHPPYPFLSTPYLYTLHTLAPHLDKTSGLYYELSRRNTRVRIRPSYAYARSYAALVRHRYGARRWLAFAGRWRHVPGPVGAGSQKVIDDSRAHAHRDRGRATQQCPLPPCYAC